MPFDLSEIANDPDLGQLVTIYRSSGGQFVSGGWINNTTTIRTTGVWTVASPNRLERVPEGDRISGSMELVSPIRIYQTNEDAGVISDQVVWNDTRYKVVDVSPWKDFGFWSAVLVRMPGN